MYTPVGISWQVHSTQCVQNEGKRKDIYCGIKYGIYNFEMQHGPVLGGETFQERFMSNNDLNFEKTTVFSQCGRKCKFEYAMFKNDR